MNRVEHCELITNQRQTERRKLPIVCQEMSPLSLKHIFPGLCYFNPSTGTGDLWKMKYEHSIDKKITFKGFWKRRNRSPQESLPEPCKNTIGWIIVIFLLCFKKKSLPGLKNTSQLAFPTAREPSSAFRCLLNPSLAPTLRGRLSRGSHINVINRLNTSLLALGMCKICVWAHSCRLCASVLSQFSQ